MNPRRFLFIIGPVLITLGLLGILGILRTISPVSFFHPPYWINWVHLTLGVAVLVVAFKGGKRWQAWFTGIAAVLGTTLGLLGLLFGPYAAIRFQLPELADPSDHIAHLTVGLFAIWGWLNRKR